MAWISLLIAGLFEVVWATAIKLSNGFSHPLWTLATIIGMTISFGGLVLATKHLPSVWPTPFGPGLGPLAPLSSAPSTSTTSLAP